MARSEARVLVEIWDDDDFLARSEGAQRMYLFLLSQRDLAYTGVIGLRERRWARTTPGASVGDVMDRLAELDKYGFVVVDEDAEEVLIRSFIRRDKVYKQPQLIRAAADQICLISSPRVRRALAVELERIACFEGLHEDSAKTIAAMLADLGHPDDHPPLHPDRQGADHPDEDPAVSAPGERGVVTAVTTEDSPNLFLLDSEPKASPSSGASAPRAKRATRIPTTFDVTPEMRAWAAERVPYVDIDFQTEKFVNYWRGKSGQAATKLDWPATWRNWMLTATERMPAGRGNPAGRGAGPHRPFTNPADAAAYDGAL